MPKTDSWQFQFEFGCRIQEQLKPVLDLLLQQAYY